MVGSWREIQMIGQKNLSSIGTWIFCCVRPRTRRSELEISHPESVSDQVFVFLAFLLCTPQEKWKLQKQMGPLDYLEEQSGNDAVWRQNYSSLEEHTDKVLEVMVDQASRGHVLQLSEEEARKRFPKLTVSSLGAQRKEKMGGVITTRVLLDGTHGIAVNHQTRAIISFFVLCSVLGVPLSWKKTAGCDTVSWVGLLHRSYKIGLSERRSQWFQRWTRETR